MITAPVIRYHGGKFQLAPHRINCEPFGGYVDGWHAVERCTLLDEA